MTKEKSKISKITITIAGQEVVCTPEQVRDLKQALEEMYPTPKEVEHVHHYDWFRTVPKPYWYEPYCMKYESKDRNVMLCAS